MALAGRGNVFGGESFDGITRVITGVGSISGAFFDIIDTATQADKTFADLASRVGDGFGNIIPGAISTTVSALAAVPKTLLEIIKITLDADRTFVGTAAGGVRDFLSTLDQIGVDVDDLVGKSLLNLEGALVDVFKTGELSICLLYTSPSPRDS